MTTVPKLTPAQAQQLVELHRGNRDAVNLGVMRGLVRKGLVRERYGGELAMHCRLASAYPLTDLGEVTANALNQEART